MDSHSYWFFFPILNIFSSLHVYKHCCLPPGKTVLYSTWFWWGYQSCYLLFLHLVPNLPPWQWASYSGWSKYVCWLCICYKNEHLTQLSQPESLTGIEYTNAETVGLLTDAHVSWNLWQLTCLWWSTKQASDEANSYCYCQVTSVVSDSVWPHRPQPTRLRSPWDSPGKNTRVSCHCLLQCMKGKSESEVTQLRLTLSDPMPAAYQAPLSMGFSRQEYWSGVSLPSPEANRIIGKT